MSKNSGFQGALKVGEALFRAGFEVDNISLPLDPGESKQDVNSYFKLHSVADFNSLPRTEYYNLRLRRATQNANSPQEKLRAVKQLAGLAGSQDALLTKHYAGLISKEFPGFDKRKIEAEISKSKSDGGKESGKKDFEPLGIAQKLVTESRIMQINRVFHQFDERYYKQISQEKLDQLIISEINRTDILPFHVSAVREFISTLGFRPKGETNRPGHLTLLNGNLEIDSDYWVEEHSPDTISTTCLNVALDPMATCLKWLKYLDQVLPQKKQQQLLQEFMGYSLTADTSLQKALILYGPGDNGKTVSTTVWQALLGPENVCNLELKDFGHRFRTVRLMGKLLNIASETDTGAFVSDSETKKIIDGLPLEAEFKGRDAFQFDPFCKIVVVCNTLPRVSDRTFGWKRRWEILTFNQQISQDPAVRDRFLAKKIIETELAGVLVWAIAGYKRLKEQGAFTVPESSITAKAQYERQVAPELIFFDEYLEATKDESQTIYLSSIYDKYEAWTKADGYKPLSKQNLHAEIKRRFNLNYEESPRDKVGVYVPKLVFKP